jgi:hypothetical protein
MRSGVAGVGGQRAPKGGWPGQPQAGGYPRAGYPDVDVPEAGYPGAGSPRADGTQAGYPHAGVPEAGYPQAGYPEAGYPEAGYPEAGYPEAGYPRADCTQAGAPMAGPARSDGAGRPPGSRRRRRRWRSGLMLAALIVSLAGLAASVTGIVVQVLPRRFTAAEQQQITAWEIGKRWRTWSAGQIFPATIPYRASGFAPGDGNVLHFTAHRIGIASQASCGSATDPPVARVLAKHGCLAVLRATYGDATGALAVTVGIVVLPGPASAKAALAALPRPTGLAPGIRAVPFARTLAAQFGDAQRQLSSVNGDGPYLVMSTIGYADGRRGVRKFADPYIRDEMLGVVHGIAAVIGSRLDAPPPAPHCPGAPGC